MHFVQFHYTLHFLNRFLNIHSNIHFFFKIYAHLCIILLYTSLHYNSLHTWLLKRTNYTIFAQLIFNIYSLICTIFCTFILYTSLLNEQITQYLLNPYYTFSRFNFYICNLGQIIHIKKLKTQKLTIHIQSILNISFFLYLHFPHISVKCFTF